MSKTVRVYTGAEGEANVIGFDADVFYSSDDPRFDEFMAERGYKTQDIEPDKALGSLSLRHIEIRPPLTEEHLKELARLCTGERVDGVWYPGIVNDYREPILVVDCRPEVPHFDTQYGTIIGRG